MHQRLLDKLRHEYLLAQGALVASLAPQLDAVAVEVMSLVAREGRD